MTNTYTAGSLVRVATWSGLASAPAGGFRDANGNFVDPQSIVLKYQPGTGQSTVTVAYPSAPIVKDGVGLYHADLDTTATSGQWIYEWDGTGGVQAIAASFFTVTAAPL